MSQRRIAQGVVQQRGQVLIDRVDQVDLVLQEPRERLDVPGLVHGLGGRVELRVQVRDDLDDLGRAYHRALLAVQELRELPGLEVLAHLGATCVVCGVPHRAAEQRMELVGQLDRVHRVDVLRPVDARLRIPLLVLSLLIQRKEPGAPVVVLPREARVAGAGDLPRVGRGHVRVLVPRGHELPPLCPV